MTNPFLTSTHRLSVQNISLVCVPQACTGGGAGLQTCNPGMGLQLLIPCLPYPLILSHGIELEATAVQGNGDWRPGSLGRWAPHPAKDPCNLQEILLRHQVLSALLVALGYREEM